MGKKLFSVIIATRNRAGMLRRCLAAIAALEFDRSAFEVLVVDNASQDSTQEICRRERERGNITLRCISEPRVGLSHARNAGAANAKGEHIIFLDDDALVTPNWLRGYEVCFHGRNEAIVQGRILVRFLPSRPRWVKDELLPSFGELDQGDSPGPLTTPLHGGNLGVAREVFEKVGGFRVDMGLGTTFLGEDTDFGLRATALGFRAVYAPGALAYHVITRERSTRSALLRRCYRSGLSQPLLLSYNRSAARAVIGLCRDVLISLAERGMNMVEYCNLSQHLGRVVQIARLRSRG